MGTADYNRHMDILQDLQLRLLEVLEHEHIDLAQPTQRVRVERPVAVETELIGDDKSLGEAAKESCDLREANCRSARDPDSGFFLLRPLERLYEAARPSGDVVTLQDLQHRGMTLAPLGQRHRERRLHRMARRTRIVWIHEQCSRELARRSRKRG